MGADLQGVDLSYANISLANLFEVNLYKAILRYTAFQQANLYKAILCDAALRGADLRMANLWGSDLKRADLRDANLRGADLSHTNLREADLRDANPSYTNLNEASLRDATPTLTEASLSHSDLSRAVLVGTNLTKATLKDCCIFGISAWDITLADSEQLDLIITREDQSTITVDNLKVAQFIYLLLNNAEIRDVIDTIARKVVLILGRFSPTRKAVLDALRDELRKHDYLPVLFDFEKPASRDLTETVNTLAHLARFIIADLTEPNSIPHEVATIIPQLKVPVQPLLMKGDAIHAYPMFRDLRMYPWVLPTVRYEDTLSLLAALNAQVIEPAERKAKELARLKAED